MKKQTFIQGTVILIVVGMVVKVLGLVNRMALARLLTTEGLGIYMMVMPTFVLIISLATLGFPISISKLVSENNIKKTIANKVIVLKALKISLINSIFLMGLLFLSAGFLSDHLLNDGRTYLPLLMLIIFIPLVSFSSILKGYLNGYKIISVPSYSQLIEQIVRIFVSIGLVIILLPYSIEWAVSGAVLSLALGELVSLVYLIYKIKNKRSFSLLLKTEEHYEDVPITKEILWISLPATGSRLIGSLSHFFEPIVFSLAMIQIGISSHYVTEIYGQITGYTLSLLLVPSFFCVALSTPLIPIISEAYANHNSSKIAHYFNLSLFLSFLIGGLFTIILTLYPKELMQLFFNSTEGTVFLSYMAPLFLIYYFQLPITSALHSINKAKEAMMNTFIGAVVKLGLMYVLITHSSVHVHGLTLAIIVNSILVTVLDFYSLQKSIKINYRFLTISLSLMLLGITYFLGLILKTINLSPFLTMLILTLFYIGIVFGTNLGDIRKIKSQFKKSRPL